MIYNGNSSACHQSFDRRGGAESHVALRLRDPGEPGLGVAFQGREDLLGTRIIRVTEPVGEAEAVHGQIGCSVGGPLAGGEQWRGEVLEVLLALGADDRLDQHGVGAAGANVDAAGDLRREDLGEFDLGERSVEHDVLLT